MKDDPSSTLITLLYGPDKPGLVSRTAGWIFEHGGNILHADQHRDDTGGVFFQRIEWSPGSPPAKEIPSFRTFAEELGMNVRIMRANERLTVALFVSKIEHCFVDFLSRWRMGDLACDIACVISNHDSLRDVAEFYGVPFYHIPVISGEKDKAEDQQLEILKSAGVDLVVMTRYMQILSEHFLEEAGCPVINIHHSFLPAFAGAKPYHQAYERGVKLIGATAHYATAILDDGPIIQQDVCRVTHRDSVADLVRKGRDLEKSVLAQAVRWHLDHRVLAYGNKTVVFD